MEIGEREEGKRQPGEEEGFRNVKGYGESWRIRVRGRRGEKGRKDEKE